MKTNLIRILWGVILISIGGVSLADKLGYVSLDALPQEIGAISFAILSGASFLSYFLSGVRNWGWFFPALIFAALALTNNMIFGHTNDAIIAFPILISIAIPFYIGYGFNRRQWGLLIPAWVLTVCSVVPVISEIFPGEIIYTLFFYATGIPFFIVYLAARQHKWALIVAAVLGIIGLFPMVGTFDLQEFEGPVVMALIALPFYLTFFLSKKLWWALIPAGFFTTIGVVAVVSTLFPTNDGFTIANLEFNLYTSVMFLGWAITFGVLWLLRATRPTGWAKHPAIGLLTAAVLVFWLGRSSADYLPGVTLLVIGVIIIVFALFRKKSSTLPTS